MVSACSSDTCCMAASSGLQMTCNTSSCCAHCYSVVPVEGARISSLGSPSRAPQMLSACYKGKAGLFEQTLCVHKQREQQDRQTVPFVEVSARDAVAHAPTSCAHACSCSHASDIRCRIIQQDESRCCPVLKINQLLRQQDSNLAPAKTSVSDTAMPVCRRTSAKQSARAPAPFRLQTCSGPRFVE